MEVLIFSAWDKVDHLSQLRVFFSNFIFSSQAVKLKRRPLAELEITSKINDSVGRWTRLSNVQLQNGSIKGRLKHVFEKNVGSIFFSLNRVVFYFFKNYVRVLYPLSL